LVWSEQRAGNAWPTFIGAIGLAVTVIALNVALGSYRQMNAAMSVARGLAEARMLCGLWHRASMNQVR